MEGTDFDKHFKGYQPQPVVESDAADFKEADMEAADLEAEEMLAADIEAEEMFAAGSEADGSVPPYPSFSTPAVPSQSGTPTVLFDRDACRRKRATKKTIKNQKQRIESSSDSDLTQEEELSEVMEAGRKRGDQIMNWGSSEDDSD